MDRLQAGDGAALIPLQERGERLPLQVAQAPPGLPGRRVGEDVPVGADDPLVLLPRSGCAIFVVGMNACGTAEEGLMPVTVTAKVRKDGLLALPRKAGDEVQVRVEVPEVGTTEGEENPLRGIIGLGGSRACRWRGESR